MDEEQKAQGQNQENSVGNNDEGDKPQSNSILDRVVKENERMEQNIKRQEEIIRKQEEISAKQILEGRTEAGTTPVVKEETPKEYKDRVMRGER